MTIQKPPFPYEEYQALLREAFACGHVSRRFCASRDSRQRWLIREQCIDCGKFFRRQLPFSVLGDTAPESLSDCDLAAAQRYSETYSAAASPLYARFASARIESWWSQYSTYLASDEWRECSRATIAAAGGICTYCCQRPAVQAHHVSYARVGCEHPDDLRAICSQCHRQEHPRIRPESPNHALQRTVPRVTLPASCPPPSPPSAQVARRAPRSLSLGS